MVNNGQVILSQTHHHAQGASPAQTHAVFVNGSRLNMINSQTQLAKPGKQSNPELVKHQRTLTATSQHSNGPGQLDTPVKTIEVANSPITALTQHEMIKLRQMELKRH